MASILLDRLRSAAEYTSAFSRVAERGGLIVGRSMFSRLAAGDIQNTALARALVAKPSRVLAPSSPLPACRRRCS